MEFKPLVSVVIPVYNGSNYLREAIDSALAQTYKNIEVIVVNDGSTDGGKTEEIAKSYGDRLRYLYKKNGGVASALNAGIKEMRGEYFSWLSHDDVYYPNKIEVLLNYLKSEDRNVILYSDYDLIDSKSNYVRTERIKHIAPENFRQSLIMSHPIHGCTALVPKECYKKTGLFNEELKVVQDYDLWFRMAGHCQFKHIPEVLIKWRIHPEQGTHSMEETRIEECNAYYIKCLNEIFQESTALSKRSQALFDVKAAIKLHRRRYSKAAIHAYRLSLKYPGKIKKYLDLVYLFLRINYHVTRLQFYVKNLRRRKKKK